MNGIFFLVFATFIIYLSIKLSYLANKISEQTQVGSFLIGGIFLAGITSLPELVTAISSIYMNNPYLAIGDILGSNVFNITFMAFFDILFIKRMFFNKTKKVINVFIFLIINYIFILLSSLGYLNNTYLNLSIASLFILTTYIVYLLKISKHDNNEKHSVNSYSKDTIKLWTSFIVCSLFIIIVSILLTGVVNKISLANPSFSGSFIGSLLLGTITSLPEVITFYALIKIGNYDMALSDIIGSNLFNLVILVVGDLILQKQSIYFYIDLGTNILIIMALFNTSICMIQNNKNKSKNKITYIIPSLVTIILYIIYLLISL